MKRGMDGSQKERRPGGTDRKGFEERGSLGGVEIKERGSHGS